jgi:Tfp pilus assembly protein PilF
VRGKLSFWIAAAALVPALAAGCTSTAVQSNSTFPKQSWTDKVSSGFKSGASKMAAMVAPKSDEKSESIFAPKKKPSPGPYVALAELQEQQGNIASAEVQLKKALSIDPNHLGALLAYAHLEDRQRNFQAAERYYQRALKKHGKNASVHNDMGLCYHRHNKLFEANQSLSKAVELDPDSKLYRANLAAVLVDQGKNSEALEQLVQAHGQPVGHYNLGYLLMQKKDTASALQHFQEAARLDPTFNEARQWVAQLGAPQQRGVPIVTQQPATMVARREPYAPGSIATGGQMPYPAANGQASGASYPVAPAGTNSAPTPGTPGVYR